MPKQAAAKRAKKKSAEEEMGGKGQNSFDLSTRGLAELEKAKRLLSEKIAKAKQR